MPSCCRPASEIRIERVIREAVEKRSYSALVKLLNEEESNVSQDHKQLLTIARAILADPKILILDEATNSVDTSHGNIDPEGHGQPDEG
jgi:ABC-type multidrug transport system fused ATPase/permease subunit